MPVTPEIWMGIWEICKPTAEEEMLQEGQITVVMQVTHWSSTLGIHSSILSPGPGIRGKDSNQLMEALNWVIGLLYWGNKGEDDTTHPLLMHACHNAMSLA